MRNEKVSSVLFFSLIIFGGLLARQLQTTSERIQPLHLESTSSRASITKPKVSPPKTKILVQSTRSRPVQQPVPRNVIVEYIKTVFGTNARMALAICMAESGCRPRAVSPTGDYGVFQVNHRWHPQYTIQQLFDYKINTQAAYLISSGGRNWNPWSTYRNRSYLKFL